MPGLPVYKEANWTVLLAAAKEQHAKLAQDVPANNVQLCADANRLLLQWMELRSLQAPDRHVTIDVFPRTSLLSLYAASLSNSPVVYVLPEYINSVTLHLRTPEAVFNKTAIGLLEDNVKQYDADAWRQQRPPVQPQAHTIIMSDILQTLAVSPVSVIKNVSKYASKDTCLYLSVPDDPKAGRIFKFVTGPSELPVNTELQHATDEVIWNYSKDEITSVLVAAGWRPIRFGYTMSGNVQYLNVASMRLHV